MMKTSQQLQNYIGVEGTLANVPQEYIEQVKAYDQKDYKGISIAIIVFKDDSFSIAFTRDITGNGQILNFDNGSDMFKLKEFIVDDKDFKTVIEYVDTMIDRVVH